MIQLLLLCPRTHSVDGIHSPPGESYECAQPIAHSSYDVRSFHVAENAARYNSTPVPRVVHALSIAVVLCPHMASNHQNRTPLLYPLLSIFYSYLVAV